MGALRWRDATASTSSCSGGTHRVLAAPYGCEPPSPRTLTQHANPLVSQYHPPPAPRYAPCSRPPRRHRPRPPVRRQRTQPTGRPRATPRTRAQIERDGCHYRLIASATSLDSVESPQTKRLDPHNGLMLAPHIDVLFDRGLITFTDDGALVTSPELSEDTATKLGLPRNADVGRFRGEQAVYLARHRAGIFRG